MPRSRPKCKKNVLNIQRKCAARVFGSDCDNTSCEDEDQDRNSLAEGGRCETQDSGPIRGRIRKRKMGSDGTGMVSTGTGTSSKLSYSVEKQISENVEHMTEHIGKISRAINADQGTYFK